jgi:hypothetical protein
MRHATALLYHVCAVASRNIRLASCGTSGKLTLWTRYVYFVPDDRMTATTWDPNPKRFWYSLLFTKFKLGQRVRNGEFILLHNKVTGTDFCRWLLLESKACYCSEFKSRSTVLCSYSLSRLITELNTTIQQNRTIEQDNSGAPPLKITAKRETQTKAFSIGCFRNRWRRECRPAHEPASIKTLSLTSGLCLLSGKTVTNQNHISTHLKHISTTVAYFNSSRF